MDWHMGLAPQDPGDARMLDQLDDIRSSIGHLQRQLTDGGTRAEIVISTLAALGEIQSKITALIGIEFYGLDDLNDSRGG
jgi:hypothetical protein